MGKLGVGKFLYGVIKLLKGLNLKGCSTTALQLNLKPWSFTVRTSYRCVEYTSYFHPITRAQQLDVSSLNVCSPLVLFTPCARTALCPHPALTLYPMAAAPQPPRITRHVPVFLLEFLISFYSEIFGGTPHGREARNLQPLTPLSGGQRCCPLNVP